MSDKSYQEINFDGLIGPTHNFAGLSYGNIPSQAHKHLISHPKKAALQGLQKMHQLMSLGLTQVVVPPQERPYLRHLHDQGFRGSDKKVLDKLATSNPDLLYEISSASSMWTANAATVTPSIDAADDRLHLTFANLRTEKHRSIEPEQTHDIFMQLMPPTDLIVYHDALKDDAHFDEGAANHMRLCPGHGERGLAIFVYGANIADSSQPVPSKFPARQSFEASMEIVKYHHIPQDQFILLQQNPDVIDQGVFHNDLIATSNENMLLYHREAFVKTKEAIDKIREGYEHLTQKPLFVYEVQEEQVSVKQAIDSFLFNSQIVTKPNGAMMLLAAEECQEKKVKDVIESIIQQDNPVEGVIYTNLNESMSNGGGPACLRLRAVLSEQQRSHLHAGCVLNNDLYLKLIDWVERCYRDRLHLDDLKDYEFLKESRAALDQLTQILDLGSLYSFQKN